MSTTDTGPRDDAGMDVGALEDAATWHEEEAAIMRADGYTEQSKRLRDNEQWAKAIRAARQRIAELEREAANLRQSVAWAGP